MSGDNAKSIISNFSIEYILNRPDNRQHLSHHQNDLIYRKDKNIVTIKQSNVRSDLMTLPWLHCTRFSPPKIPRCNKKAGRNVAAAVPAKRQLGRHPRIPFTNEQINVLENQYKQTPYLSSEQVNRLSEMLELADIRIKIWFQNRRARERRERNQTAESAATSPNLVKHPLENERIDRFNIGIQPMLSTCNGFLISTDNNSTNNKPCTTYDNKK